MEIKVYGLGNHPDISSFFDDYGVDDSAALFTEFDRLADTMGGYKVNAVEYYADGEQRIELHVLCDHNDDAALRKAAAAYLGKANEAVENPEGWDPEMTPIKNLKKGDYFTLKPIESPRESQVYVADGYDRYERKYYAYKFSDINQGRYFPGDKEVCTNIRYCTSSTQRASSQGTHCQSDASRDEPLRAPLP